MEFRKKLKKWLRPPRFIKGVPVEIIYKNGFGHPNEILILPELPSIGSTIIAHNYGDRRYKVIDIVLHVCHDARNNHFDVICDLMPPEYAKKEIGK